LKCFFIAKFKKTIATTFSKYSITYVDDMYHSNKVFASETRAMEPEPKKFWIIGVGARNFRWCGRSRTFEFQFHSPGMWGKRVN